MKVESSNSTIVHRSSEISAPAKLSSPAHSLELSRSTTTCISVLSAKMNVMLDAFERALYTRQASSTTQHHGSIPAVFAQRARRRSMTLCTSPIHIVSTQQQRRSRSPRHPTTTMMATTAAGTVRRMSCSPLSALPQCTTAIQQTFPNPTAFTNRSNALTVGGSKEPALRKYSDGGLILGGELRNLELEAAQLTTTATARRASFNPIASDQSLNKPGRRKTSAVAALLAGAEESLPGLNIDPTTLTYPTTTRSRPSNSFVVSEEQQQRPLHPQEISSTTPPPSGLGSSSTLLRSVSPAAAAVAQRMCDNNNKPPLHRQLAYCMTNGMQQLGAMKSEEVIEVLSPPRMTAAVDGQQPGQTRKQLQPRAVILGFVRFAQSSADDFSASSASSSNRSGATLFRGERDHGLDRALGECNTIRNRGSELDQGLLLRCMDRGALYPFMHYTIYRGVGGRGGGGEESVGAGRGIMQGRLRQLIAELKASPATEFASYEEIYAIQKSVSSASSSAGDSAGLLLSSGRHSGYIVSFFKLLDQSYRQVELERTWLSWTGAREIYKYSPRNWNLRRITLHKHYTGGASTSSASSFAYVLICEFNNILHPSNMLQAMDMCERLRARNCGYIALYQVQHSYGGGEQVPSLQGSGGTGRPNSMAASQKPPPLHATSTTHKMSPQKSAPSTWSSPIAQKVLHSLPKDPSPLAATASVRRRELLRGYSQDVDSTHDALRRRGALLRMRDRSLGYEQQQAGVMPASGNDQRRGSTADGGVVLGSSYSPLHMPSSFNPTYTVGGPLHCSSGSLPQSSTPPEMRGAAQRSARDFAPPAPFPSSYYPRAPPPMPNYPGSSSTGLGGAGQAGPLMDYVDG